MIKPWLNMVKPQGLQLFWRLYGEIPSIALGPLGPCLQWSATRTIEGWEAASLGRAPHSTQFSVYQSIKK